jgi:ubiquinone/menaquinone biosynthesis C-methylase UbiE
MGFYDRNVLPPLLDFAMRQKPIMKQREKIVPRARGKVLEIGIGSGLNLAFYDPEKVATVWGLDPSLELQKRALARAARASIGLELIGLSGEQIPIEDAFFDTVLVTYTLCTIPDVERALGEMSRVLKPGGELLFCEHGLAPDAPVERRQQSWNRWWPKIAGGCNLTRRIPDLVRGAGFELRELNAAYIPGLKPLAYNYWGVAAR